MDQDARHLAAATLGRFARLPAEKEWIQFQFYHWVLDDQRPAFRRQLTFLRRHGDFISLDDALVAMRSSSGIGGRYFCLTFDDGFLNWFTNVVPVLSELKIPAAFFIPTQFIGLDTDRDWDRIAPFYERCWSECRGVFEFLDWEKCAQIAAAGFTIGSHSHSHRRLAELPPKEAWQEMTLSREIIEEKLRRPCRHFCCPWGKAGRDFDPVLHPKMAREAGYDSFLTTEDGLSKHGDSAFYIRRTGCEPDFGPAALLYSLFPPFRTEHEHAPEAQKGFSGVAPAITHGKISVSEVEPATVGKFPYPFEAAFTVASDIDSASVARFRAVHTLFCGDGVIHPGTTDWDTLGLSRGFELFNAELGGIRALGLDLADSFFLVGDKTTFGIYRHHPDEDRFQFDRQDGEDCGQLIREWLRQGQIDAFHGFLHYTREQLTPLLNWFYRWCEHEGVGKPKVWINHSLSVTPTGLCPRNLQPNAAGRLIRLSGRNVIGPVIGFRRLPLRNAFARYEGDNPGSPHYVNDLLAANGVRYVWLNMHDLHRNRIVHPEHSLNGRETILDLVTMDDGVRYYRFERCCGRSGVMRGGEAYLRNSADGFDASSLITESNLENLCRAGGSCILFVHWTHPRSFPISTDTLARFDLLRQWRDAGRIWVTTTAKLLEWTRRRTFLRVASHRVGQQLIIEIDGVDDPVFGHEAVSLADLDGLCLHLSEPNSQVTVAIDGGVLDAKQVHHIGNLCWLESGESAVWARQHRSR